MKFMIDVVMLRNSVALLVYDYVLIVAGSRIYAEQDKSHFNPWLKTLPHLNTQCASQPALNVT